MKSQAKPLLERWRLLLLVLIPFAGTGIILISEGWHFRGPDREAVHLALAVPLSGPNRAVGISFRKGVVMAVDEINEEGGIDDHPLVLDLYDDQGMASEAEQVARRIVRDGHAVAVAGHSFSSCCIAAGPVYKEAHIPAITGQATNVRVTLNNDWYFRTIFNDAFQGRFLTSFISKLAEEKNISIIHEDLAYGSELARIVATSAWQNGLNLRYQWDFSVDDPRLEQRLARIAQELYSHVDAGIVIIACHTNEGSLLIRALKDAGVNNKIVVPHTFDSRKFLNSFDATPREQYAPGYYTNGIYVSSPLIFATANGRAQKFRRHFLERYAHEPEWRAAYGYDTAMVLIRAMMESGISGRAGDLAADRAKVRAFLASLNQPDTAIEGTTGLNYFDRNGDAVKPVSIGIFSSRTTIPAPVQLQALRSTDNPAYLFDSQMKGDIIVIERQLLHRARVVYTGVKFRRISAIRPDRAVAHLDFDIWFRYSGSFDTRALEFDNALQPVELVSAVQEGYEDGRHYKRFRVSGLFQLDFQPDFRQPGRHQAGFALHHGVLPHHSLILVNDSLGMGLDCEKDEHLPRPPVTPPEWKAGGIFAFQDVVRSITGGALYPTSLNRRTMDFSTYNVCISLDRAGLALALPVPDGWLLPLLGISVAGMLSLLVLAGSPLSRDYSRSYFAALLCCATVMLLCLEPMLVHWQVPDDESVMQVTATLWWGVAAAMLWSASAIFLWQPAQRVMQRRIPPALNLFAILFIFGGAMVAILWFVLDQAEAAMALTGLLVVILPALLAWMHPVDMLAALAIRRQGRFKPGDMLKVDGYGPGRVMDIGWQFTRFRLSDRKILVLANHQLLDSPLILHHEHEEESL